MNKSLESVDFLADIYFFPCSALFECDPSWPLVRHQVPDASVVCSLRKKILFIINFNIIILKPNIFHSKQKKTIKSTSTQTYLIKSFKVPEIWQTSCKTNILKYFFLDKSI